MCKCPQLLFLDKAISHLDVAAEQKINRIIVAHRPESTASADRVIEPKASSRELVLTRGQADAAQGFA